MSVQASWTCNDVSGGYSTFCDNFWPIWEIDFVNTGILTGIVTAWIGVWALIFGAFQSQKKEAFMNPWRKINFSKLILYFTSTIIIINLFTLFKLNLIIDQSRRDSVISLSSIRFDLVSERKFAFLLLYFSLWPWLQLWPSSSPRSFVWFSMVFLRSGNRLTSSPMTFDSVFRWGGSTITA